MTGKYRYSVGELTIIGFNCKTVDEIKKVQDFIYDEIEENKESYTKFQLKVIFDCLQSVHKRLTGRA